MIKLLCELFSLQDFYTVYLLHKKKEESVGEAFFLHDAIMGKIFSADFP